MENKMKEYLGEEYSEINHLLNWFIYWSKGKGKVNDEWRLKNDLDCLYLECLEADTIISMWQICIMVYRTLNPDSNLALSKNPRCIKEIFLDNSDNLEKYFPSENELVKKLQKLAKLAEKRANVMLLPSRIMQRRGAWYADQIPPTLYQCFEGGTFSKCFNSYDELKKWIETQHLEIAFKDEQISKDNITPIANGFEAKQCIKRTKKEYLINAVLDYSISFLEARMVYYI